MISILNDNEDKPDDYHVYYCINTDNKQYCEQHWGVVSFMDSEVVKEEEEEEEDERMEV